MYKSLAYSYLPILVLILVSGPSVGNLRLAVLGSTTQSSSSCNTQFNYNHVNPISVLVIRSGSTGKICVQYSSPYAGSPSNPSYISVYQYNSTGEYGVCPDCSFNIVTSLFKPTASPPTVTFPNTNNSTVQKETVTYTITVPSSIKSGIFGVFLFQFCSLFPVAVVPNGGTDVLLTSSEFSSWYPHYGSCPAQFLRSSVIGVDGFQIVSLWFGSAMADGTNGQASSSELMTRLLN